MKLHDLAPSRSETQTKANRPWARFWSWEDGDQRAIRVKGRSEAESAQVLKVAKCH